MVSKGGKERAIGWLTEKMVLHFVGRKEGNESYDIVVVSIKLLRKRKRCFFFFFQWQGKGEVWKGGFDVVVVGVVVIVVVVMMVVGSER